MSEYSAEVLKIIDEFDKVFNFSGFVGHHYAQICESLLKKYENNVQKCKEILLPIICKDFLQICCKQEGSGLKIMEAGNE